MLDVVEPLGNGICNGDPDLCGFDGGIWYPSGADSGIRMIVGVNGDRYLVDVGLGTIHSS